MDRMKHSIKVDIRDEKASQKASKSPPLVHLGEPWGTLGLPWGGLGCPWVPLGPPSGRPVTKKCHYQECLFYCCKTGAFEDWVDHGVLLGGHVGSMGEPLWGPMGTLGSPWIILGPLRLRLSMCFFFRLLVCRVHVGKGPFFIEI